MGTLYIIRGLPGSGKSTTADIFRKQNIAVFASDDFFLNAQGVYNFDASKLAEAHKQCEDNVNRVMNLKRDVAVEGTFTMDWEALPDFSAAERNEYRVVIIDCGDGGCSDEQLAARNIHGVPLHTIQKMRQRWHFNIWQ